MLFDTKNSPYAFKTKLSCEINKSKTYESYKHGIMISDFRENCIKTFLLFPCIFEKQHILLLLKQLYSHSDGVVSIT